MTVPSMTTVDTGEDELLPGAVEPHRSNVESADRRPTERVRTWRYLPLVLAATAALTVLPLELAMRIMPRGHGALYAIASAALAVALAMIFARLGTSAWTRWRRSRDILFAELILWGWLRRGWAEWRLRRARLEYENVAKVSPQLRIELLERMTKLLQTRDPYTHGHSQRVARHAVRIARTMRVPTAEVAKIRAAAAIHDVGKLYTPLSILHNPGALSDEEFEVIKRHPVDGADMVEPAGDSEITAMVRHHHERLSGGGYPDGLVGEQIPLGARIIAVADTFDAITSTRSYRRASSHKSALDVLAKEAGVQLDTAAVAAFRKSYAARRAVALTALATAIPQRALAWLQASGAGVGAGSLPQVLPVVGAAGALALAHGHAQRQTTARHPNSAANTHLRSVSTNASLASGRAHAKRLGAHAPTSAPKRGGGVPRVVSPRALGPKHAGGGSGSGSHGSSTPAPTSAPQTHASEPTGTTTTPAPPPPQEKTIPTVPIPPVSTPTVPIPPVNVPEVGGVKVPSAKVSVNVAGVEVGL